MRVQEIPEPDEFGNYWLGRNRKDGPAIFPSKYLDYSTMSSHGRAMIREKGTFYLFLGEKEGFLFKREKEKREGEKGGGWIKDIMDNREEEKDRDYLEQFRTVEEAYQELVRRGLVRGRGVRGHPFK